MIEDGHAAVRLTKDPASYLSDLMAKYKSPVFPNRPKMTGGACGIFWLRYGALYGKTLTHAPQDDLDMPDCHLMLYDEIVAFDHLTNKAVIILNIYADEGIDEQYGACIQKRKKLREG